MPAPKARVTMRERKPRAAPASASQELIANALKESVVTDAQGRKITIRKPNPLAQFRLIEAVGAESAANETYMRMVNPLIWVAAIDGDPIRSPETKLDVEAIIQRLDEDGLGALMSWYFANVMVPTNSAIEAAVQAAKEKAALKN